MHRPLLLCLILLLLSSFSPPPGCLKVDVVLVADMSASVHTYEPFVVVALSTFVNQFELDEGGIKIGVITFSDYATTVVPLTDDKNLLQNRLLTLYNAAAGGTNMQSGLTAALDEFIRHGRPGYSRLIVLISDGAIQAAQQTVVVSKQLQLTGINVCGILIVNNDSAEEVMHSLVSNECYYSSSYEDLVREIKKLDICI